ncbi:MAG TPA: hypothetical protein ENK52_05170 [Saprospiraceae bacterium]|nr:hypothetical protein [Saprospiraceae bacterium]
MKKAFLLTLAFGLFFMSCKKDEMKVSKDFTVTIQNVIDVRDFPSSGTTGLIMPGMSESFTFNAGKGQYLKFATMFAQSNDIFYAPSDEGIALYDANGMAVTGDLSAMIHLWDAGTEVNEEPGVGMNQAPRQSAPNTGMDENGTVALVANISDGFNYPMNGLKFSLSHDGGTMFTATIENKTNMSTLASPFAPGVWVIHNDSQKPLFTEGAMASAGLEAMAEDGDNSKMNANISSKTGYVSPYAPGAYMIGDPAVFKMGDAASSALEALAEDGDPSGFNNVFNTPDGASAPGPLHPGSSYSFSFTAEEGDDLSFATMLVQSNDWFIGGNEISLFSNGTALSGDITSMVKLYDAGTEVDEFAGAGNNQPLRQSGPNTGMDENGTVKMASPGAHVPSVGNLVKVTITAN